VERLLTDLQLLFLISATSFILVCLTLKIASYINNRQHNFYFAVYYMFRPNQAIFRHVTYMFNAYIFNCAN
jgi:hypothetical protein